MKHQNKKQAFRQVFTSLVRSYFAPGVYTIGTLTTAFRPSFIVTRCTCPMLAAPSGRSSKERNMVSTGWPRDSSTSPLKKDGGRARHGGIKEANHTYLALYCVDMRGENQGRRGCGCPPALYAHYVC